MKTTTVIFLILILSGCRSTRETATTVVTDHSRISYALPTSNTLTISQLCDSITGLPVPIDGKIDTGTSKVDIRTEGNSLRIEIRTDTVYRDSIVFKDKLVTKEKSIVKTVWTKWTWGFLAIIIIFIIFPKIPAFIRSIVPI